jgi:hypothetical protein
MKKQILLTVGLMTLLASATRADQEQLATSIKAARAEAARAAEQLQGTLGALDALTKQKQGDLRPAYNAFAAEIPKTEAAAAWTRARVAWMDGDGQKYFGDWQKTIEGMTNESLKKKAQKRFNVVRKSYDKVGASLKTAGEKFRPFLSDLSDIQKALSTDITAGGVKAVKSTVSDANWQFKFVSREINDALKEMKKMEQALSPEAK